MRIELGIIIVGLGLFTTAGCSRKEDTTFGVKYSPQNPSVLCVQYPWWSEKAARIQLFFVPEGVEIPTNVTTDFTIEGIRDRKNNRDQYRTCAVVPTSGKPIGMAIYSDLQDWANPKTRILELTLPPSFTGSGRVRVSVLDESGTNRVPTETNITISPLRR